MKELAKSVSDVNNPDFGQTLLGHTIYDLESFKRLYCGKDDSGTILFKDACKFFKLSLSNEEINNIFRICRISIIFHDLGKAHDKFRKMLLREEVQQCIKHEFLSAYLFCMGLDLKMTEEDRIWITSLISMHHLRFSNTTFCESLNPIGNGTIKIRKNGISEIISLYEIQFENKIDHFVQDEYDVNSEEFLKNAEIIKANLNYLFKKIKSDKRLQAIYNLCKIMIISSDASGSRIIKNEDKIDWENDCFNVKKIDKNYIYKYIIEPKIEEIKIKTGGFEFTKSQKDVVRLSSRALIIDFTSGGKTTAGYRWMAEQALNGVRSIIFLHPTKDTSTACCKSYCLEVKDLDQALLHSSSNYEIEKIYKNPEEEYHIDEKLFTMENWFKKVFCATIDQFMGFLHHNYTSTLLTNCLFSSVVIIDEVHSLDKKSFSTLIKFLNSFDIPVLCMTATLDLDRISQLKNCGLEIYESNKVNISTRSEEKKYEICIVNESDIPYIIEDSKKRSKKIISFYNKIARCQNGYLNGSMFCDDYCYHALFRTKDKQKIRDEVLDRCSSLDYKIILYCTQVAEISLDLLYVTTMITPYCEIKSFIQRLGRAARSMVGDLFKEHAKIFVYEADVENPKNKHLPYTPDDIKLCKKFIDDLVNLKNVSQNDLIECFEKYDNSNITYNSYNSFLESGIYANKQDSSFRESKTYNVSGILKSDFEEYKDKKKNKRPVDGLILPVRRKYVNEEEKADKFIYLVEDELYDKKIGLIL